jgi:hypothetical protein
MLLIMALVAFMFTMGILQAVHVLPAGDSPLKDRLKLISFFGGAVWFFLVAANRGRFPLAGGYIDAAMVGKNVVFVMRQWSSLTAVLSVFGILH